MLELLNFLETIKYLIFVHEIFHCLQLDEAATTEPLPRSQRSIFQNINICSPDPQSFPLLSDGTEREETGGELEAAGSNKGQVRREDSCRDAPLPPTAPATIIEFSLWCLLKLNFKLLFCFVFNV